MLRWPALVGLGLTGLLAACGQTVAKSSASFAAPGELALREDEIEDRLGHDVRLAEFITSLEKAVMTGDREALAASYDYRALLAEVLKGGSGAATSDSLKASYAEGMREAWSISGPLEGSLGSHYRFLRVRSIDGFDGALFRATDEEGMIDYHVHRIIEKPDGSYRIADSYIVGTSESLSTTFRRGFTHLVAGAEGRDGSFVRNLESITRIAAAVGQRRYAEAVVLCDALPPEVQSLHEVLTLRIEAASRLSPLMLDEAIGKWIAVYGGPDRLPMHAIDYHMARGEYSKAHAVARRIEALTGGDAYLKVKIGETRFAMKSRVPSVLLGGSNGSRGGTRGARGNGSTTEAVR